MNTLTKTRPGEIAVDHFHLRLLAFGGLACDGNFDQRLAQGERDGQRDFRIGDPNAVDEAECLDVFRQRLADNNGDFGFCRALVFAQLGQPAIAPVFRALAFPKNRAAALIERSDDALEHVAAELAFRHGLDRVARKFRGKQRFQLHFLNFSLKLLRALLGAPFQVFDLSLHRGDGLIFLHHFEFQFFFGFFFGLVAFRR